MKKVAWFTVAIGAIAIVGASCARHATTAAQSPGLLVKRADVETDLRTLADDSMEGRQLGSRGELKGAAYVAAFFKQLGLTLVTDSGNVLRSPYKSGGARGRGNAIAEFSALDSVPAERKGVGHNAVAIMPGTDPAHKDEWVLFDAHVDHLGIIGRPGSSCRALPAYPTDSICNGADDDASGVVAVMEIARHFANSKTKPKRTIVFVAASGEESGLIGTSWLIAHPVLPLKKLVANMEIEMIARPDSLAGGVGKAWLTGYERSTLGDSLAAHGIPVVKDPRPSQNFFGRSDNIAYARMGIPAHTFSSFNLHADYHHSSDDVAHVDFDHMTKVIDAAIRAAELIVDGTPPVWKEGCDPSKPASGICAAPARAGGAAPAPGGGGAGGR